MSYIVPSLFFLLGVLITCSNWCCLFDQLRGKRPDLDPVMQMVCGGCFMFLGFILFPGNPLAEWGWLLFFLDLGFYIFVCGFPVLLFEAFIVPIIGFFKKK